MPLFVAQETGDGHVACELPIRIGHLDLEPHGSARPIESNLEERAFVLLFGRAPARAAVSVDRPGRGDVPGGVEAQRAAVDLATIASARRALGGERRDGPHLLRPELVPAPCGVVAVRELGQERQLAIGHARWAGAIFRAPSLRMDESQPEAECAQERDGALVGKIPQLPLQQFIGGRKEAGPREQDALPVQRGEVGLERGEPREPEGPRRQLGHGIVSGPPRQPAIRLGNALGGRDVEAARTAQRPMLGGEQRQQEEARDGGASGRAQSGQQRRRPHRHERRQGEVDEHGEARGLPKLGEGARCLKQTEGARAERDTFHTEGRSRREEDRYEPEDRVCA